jgi:tyrosine-specific transport protein
MEDKPGSVLKGLLLVAGTSIGGGMLALPVLTSAAGFWPALLIYLLCWIFMACTGLLFLEICLWSDGETNLVSMAEQTLGFFGKGAAWILYLFLFYCLTLAYVVGCGNMVADLFNGAISDWVGSLLFVACFAPIVYVGARLVGRINLILMVALIFSFFLFVAVGFRDVDPALLVRRNWWLILAAMPIAFTSFAYQGIVPTLVSYMHKDPRKTRLAIILGSAVPLLVYIVWEWLILGIVPYKGPNGLQEALKQGQSAVHPLKEVLQNPTVYLVGQAFAFFAMVTSFLGVTLGLVDFLADGLKVSKTSLNKVALAAAVFLPPLAFAYTHPHIFLSALDFAGGIGCASLLGVFPIAIVWVGRYRLGMKAPYQLPGGKPVLLLLSLFVFIELTFEIYRLIR